MNKERITKTDKLNYTGTRKTQKTRLREECDLIYPTHFKTSVNLLDSEKKLFS